jgi:curved DNA-binding protein CbpA
LDIDSCLKILELDELTTKEAARQSYRDLVRVWHPDRFTQDPKLRKRAEERVKQLNAAYEALMLHMEKNERGGAAERAPGLDDKKGTSLTEAFFEAGTCNLLMVWHALNRAALSALKGAGDKGGTRTR